MTPQTRRCALCKQDLDIAYFRRMKGRNTRCCMKCEKRKTADYHQGIRTVESALNLACDAWKGRVNRNKNLTPSV